jgi:hypothetical protein
MRSPGPRFRVYAVLMRSNIQTLDVRRRPPVCGARSPGVRVATPRATSGMLEQIIRYNDYYLSLGPGAGRSGDWTGQIARYVYVTPVFSMPIRDA